MAFACTMLMAVLGSVTAEESKCDVGLSFTVTGINSYKLDDSKGAICVACITLKATLSKCSLFDKDGKITQNNYPTNESFKGNAWDYGILLAVDESGCTTSGTADEATRKSIGAKIQLAIGKSAPDKVKWGVADLTKLGWKTSEADGTLTASANFTYGTKDLYISFQGDGKAQGNLLTQDWICGKPHLFRTSIKINLEKSARDRAMV